MIQKGVKLTQNAGQRPSFDLFPGHPEPEMRQAPPLTENWVQF